MNKPINEMLEEIRKRLGVEEAAQPKLGSGERFEVLVSKLKNQKDVKDPAALAAWIGRKKYGKERFQSIGEDTESLLVFQDVEDVIAFVEGLENLTESDQIEEQFDLDHAVLGAYRTTAPKDSVKNFKRVKAAAKKYLDWLQGLYSERRELENEFIFAANALKKSMEDGYTDSRKAMPGTLYIWDLIRRGTSTHVMAAQVKHLLRSDEMRTGPSRVVARRSA